MIIAKPTNANKIYDTPAGKFPALEKSTAELNEGELLLIIGSSSSGKTTLLSLIGCLINPTEGELVMSKLLQLKKMAKVNYEKTNGKLQLKYQSNFLKKHYKQGKL